MSSIPLLVNHQRDFFASGKTRPLGARLDRLKALRETIRKFEQPLLDALKQDLNKSEFEAYATEIGLVYKEISHTLKQLRRWMKPKRIRTPLTHWGSKSYVIPEPYGVTLIIAPWNYPAQLALVPLIGAVAAGNTVVLKPSELAPHVSEVLATILEEAFEPGWATTVLGGVEESTELLAQNLDYIFFTGSVAVGRIVMTAAAKQLTPVTLELGGKSPCIVHNDANLKLAARRIAFGKYTNAGQTCVAPDYVYVHREVKQAFVAHLKQAVEEMFGVEPLLNPDYVHIISGKHYERLASFLSDGRALIGGMTDLAQRAIAPTVLEGIDWNSPVMQEEIFGPVLPLLEYGDIEEVIAAVSARPKPLALYLFSESRELQQQVVDRVSFGGGCMNDTLMHFGSPYLPIGGVGESGIGRYHGESSFFTFSHQKSLLLQTTLFDIPFRYPTSRWGRKLVRKLLR
ncbi:aldehyde dehydrogenase [Paenibacillus sedimenti]|uniref:Aldehyde dehydrogenase n=1 Tax=Paenibacillus sedimenti TaxID=2770274 RepID=A0A926QJS2_9BACL|nr:aldehyde dehydrogenase [Paenibacillus sedimenti]MBD0382031.1 aldehyde dehydrogenase [Paenibacillus sedimenti]